VNTVLSGYAFLLGFSCHCGVGYDIPKPTIQLGIKLGKGENNVMLGFVRVVGEPSSSSWPSSILITLIINILNVCFWLFIAVHMSFQQLNSFSCSACILSVWLQKFRCVVSFFAINRVSPITIQNVYRYFPEFLLYASD
jgi:hypothetical protein